MTYLGAALALMPAGLATDEWYGPVTVTTPITFTGNPYDPEENDVEVDYVGDNGVKTRRMAYYVGDGKFASTLVAPKPGSYRAKFLLNGKTAVVIDKPFDVTIKVVHGYLGLKGRRFAWSDGTPYYPVGYDYAWKSIANETVADGIRRMAAHGCNWSRIWADHWDNKNPFWPASGETMPPRTLRQDSLGVWDGIIQAAEQSNLAFQFTLFHHGPWSTTTDSNWKDNPWNRANGGFLADPTNFFTDPEAKRRTKIWLRYAVARYASSPSIMAWELFNEVQWVDAIKKHPEHTADVAAWHREMAAYVRGLDPYHHLVTSSSSESLDDHIFDVMDYLQPHTYPANVLASIGAYSFKGKPGFFGEFGPPRAEGDEYRKRVRDGIYGGMLAGHAGAGMYWYWDDVVRNGLEPDFLNARRVTELSGLTHHPDAKPLDVWADTDQRTDLTVSPGFGWGESTVSELDLPKVTLKQLAGWSQYFQSTNGGHKNWAKPLVLKFSSATAGEIQLHVGGAADQGGELQVFVNDREAVDQKVQKGTRQAVTVPYASGDVIVRIENHGADWVRLDSVTVPAIGMTVFAQGLGDGKWSLIRITGSPDATLRVSGVNLADGPYMATAFDLINSTSVVRQIRVKHGAFSASGLSADCVIDIRKE